MTDIKIYNHFSYSISSYVFLVICPHHILPIHLTCRAPRGTLASVERNQRLFVATPLLVLRSRLSSGSHQLPLSPSFSHFFFLHPLSIPLLPTRSQHLSVFSISTGVRNLEWLFSSLFPLVFLVIPFFFSTPNHQLLSYHTLPHFRLISSRLLDCRKAKDSPLLSRFYSDPLQSRRLRFPISRNYSTCRHFLDPSIANVRLHFRVFCSARCLSSRISSQ